MVAAALVVGSLGLAGPGLVAPAGAATSPIVSLVVDGRGSGHGIGASMWGVYGWATVYKKSWQDILSFYYGGTTISSLKDSDFASTAVGRMTVQLTKLDGAQTAVVSDTGALTTPADPGPSDPNPPDPSTTAPTPRSWASLVAREVPGQRNVYAVWGNQSETCPSSSNSLDPSAGWVLLTKAVAGPVIFTTPKADAPDAVTPADIVGLCEPSGTVHYYRGNILAANQSTGADRTVNDVLLEDYVRAVVDRESAPSWADAAGGSGINALRVQAVAARSFSLANPPRSSVARVCDTDSCQVYGGVGLRTGGVGTTFKRYEDPRSDRSVTDTTGVIMRTAAGKVANTMFAASNGGRSVSGGLYPAVDDLGDAVPANPYHTWSLTLTASQITAAWPSIGSLLDIVVTQRSGGGVWDGWVDKIRLTGSAKTITISGDDFRRAFGLKSRYLNFTSVRAATGDPVGPGLFVGDSVAASAQTDILRLFSKAYSVAFDAKASRCTIPVKGTCATNNALPVFDAATPAAFALLELGYNDNPAKFGGAIDQAMQALTGKGVTRVVWVNLSERRPDSKAKSYYAPANVALEAATTRWPQLIVLDWNAASIGDEATSWFLPGTATAPDLVHLTSVGRTRFALFLRSRLDDLRAQGLLPKDAPPPDTTNPTTSTTTSTAPAGSTTTSSPPPPSTNATTTTTTTVKPAARPTLKPGASGKNVMDLQNALIGRGYSLSADGQFGRKTTLAVKAFQRSKRLRADGIVGAKTWKALGL